MSAQMKREIIERERTAHDRWWRKLAGIPPDAERPDGWKLKDVVAHFSAWHRYSTGRITAIVQSGMIRGSHKTRTDSMRRRASPLEHGRRLAERRWRRIGNYSISLPPFRRSASSGMKIDRVHRARERIGTPRGTPRFRTSTASPWDRLPQEPSPCPHVPFQ